MKSHPESLLALADIPVDELYSALLGSVSDMIFLTDGEGRILYASPGAASAFDIPPEAIEEACAIENLLGNGTGQREVRDRSGNRRVLCVSFVSLAGGKRRLYTCQDSTALSVAQEKLDEYRQIEHRLTEQSVALERTLRDEVSERRWAEESLKSVEMRYRRILDTTHEGIWILDVGGKTIYANHRVAVMLGVAIQQMAGQSFYDFMEEAVRSEATECFDHWRQGATEQRDFPFRRSDGGITWTILNTNPILGDGGEFIGVLMMVTDITEHKQAEIKIRQRNRELAALHAVAASISSSLDMKEILPALKMLMIEELGIKAGCLLIAREGEEALRVEEAWGLSDAILDCLACKMPASAFGSDPEGNLSLLCSLWPCMFPRWSRHICIPLMKNKRYAGSLCLFSESETAFDEDELPFYISLGQAVGMALQNAWLFEEVREGRIRLENLSRRLVQAQENERRFMAHELHDEIGQHLTGLKYRLDTMARSPGQGAGKLEEARLQVNDLIERVRQLSLDLRPAMLDDLGLLPTLFWHFERYSSHTGIHVDFKHSGLDQRLEPEAVTAAYRIVQEALTNAARHAHVSEVIVRLWADSHALNVQVEDQGDGFDAETALAGYRSTGIHSMRERAILLGGSLIIDSSPGTGTRLVAELPFKNHPEISHEEAQNDHDRSGG